LVAVAVLVVLKLAVVVGAVGLYLVQPLYLLVLFIQLL
jgi:hypothetical protein